LWCPHFLPMSPIQTSWYHPRQDVYYNYCILTCYTWKSSCLILLFIQNVMLMWHDQPAREPQRCNWSVFVWLKNKWQWVVHWRGGEWCFENPGSRQIFARSRYLGILCGEYRNLVFAFLHFLRLGLGFFVLIVSGSDFQTRVLASLGFTIRHPSLGNGKFCCPWI